MSKFEGKIPRGPNPGLEEITLTLPPTVLPDNLARPRVGRFRPSDFALPRFVHADRPPQTHASLLLHEHGPHNRTVRVSQFSPSQHQTTREEALAGYYCSALYI